MNSAALLLKHLALATKRHIDRELARQKLAEELKAIKKISPKAVRQKLKQLERSIAKALALERKIITVQTSQEAAHTELKARLAELDRKVSEYLELVKERESRLKEIESKLGVIH